MRRLALVFALVAALPVFGQTTGTLTLLPPSGGGGVGTITAVGDCDSGDCFQAEAAGTFFAAPALGGVATFRAITLDDLPADLATDIELAAAITAHAGDADAHHVWPLTDAEIPDELTLAEASVTAHEAALTITESQISDLAHTVNTDDQTATEVPYTPTTGGDWPEGSPSEVGGALDTLAGRESGGGAFSDLTSGTNTTAAMVVGAGASLKKTSTGTIDASGIDADGDGVREISVTGSTIALDPNDDGTADINITATSINFTSTDQVSIGAGDTQIVFRNAGTSLEDMDFYVMGARLFELRSGGPINIWSGTAWGDAGNRWPTLGGNVIYGNSYIASPFSQTCADNSDGGTPGTLAITVAGRSNVRITSADPQGCNLSILETGAVDGQLLEIELVSTAGGTITLPDDPGVQNLSGDWTPGVGDSITLRYNTTASEWRERARADI